MSPPSKSLAGMVVSAWSLLGEQNRPLVVRITGRQQSIPNYETCLTLSRCAARVEATALIPRHRRSHGPDDRRRTRRCAPLPQPPRVMTLHQPGLPPVLQWRQTERAATSRKRATRTCAVSSLSRPGITDITRFSAMPCGVGNGGRQPSSSDGVVPQQRLRRRYRRLAARGKPNSTS